MSPEDKQTFKVTQASAKRLYKQRLLKRSKQSELINPQPSTSVKQKANMRDSVKIAAVLYEQLEIKRQKYNTYL